ncbi:hypothetical protein K2173_006583 [Erythroxylum novogranatense]|uniref:VQ domain-containing protein n=1 Tax=Erythroxylum novogranatense TaxID=1862640 RepID=A0AAV8T5B3_9ROSI|nr:hypothetical protein K2173_006583 [Erythroxylum novogranatense]
MANDGIKVVLVDTQYVVADPKSFKSVVQSLTGKDSCVSWIEESSFVGGKRKRPVGGGNNNRRVGIPGSGIESSPGNADLRFTKGLSFKDLDRMMLELPPMEEWYKLLADNNLV